MASRQQKKKTRFFRLHVCAEPNSRKVRETLSRRQSRRHHQMLPSSSPIKSCTCTKRTSSKHWTRRRQVANGALAVNCKKTILVTTTLWDVVGVLAPFAHVTVTLRNLGGKQVGRKLQIRIRFASLQRRLHAQIHQGGMTVMVTIVLGTLIALDMNT